MTADDIEAVVGIERASDPAPHWSRAGYQRLFEEEESSLLKRLGIVAEAEAAVIGFAVVRTLVSAAVAEAELESIVVAEPWRGRGVGRLLLAEAARSSRAQGARQLVLEVRASNVAAIGLYRKSAFLEIGRRRSYYRDPEEDAVLMSATL